MHFLFYILFCIAGKTSQWIIDPAAAPKDAKKFINTMEMFKSKPIAWEINNTPAHSYKAVVSILMVAPKSRTKLVFLFKTPTSFSTQSIVIGRVAPDELVENAVINTGAVAFKCLIGLMRDRK